MATKLETFMDNFRGRLQAQAQQVEQARKPFDPQEMLRRLLGMAPQAARLKPGTREKAEEYVTQDITSPAAEQYLRTLPTGAPSPTGWRQKKLMEMGLSEELEKYGSKPTLPKTPAAPAVKTPTKKKNWWEWDWL